jgi:hypothetical protein
MITSQCKASSETEDETSSLLNLLSLHLIGDPAVVSPSAQHQSALRQSVPSFPPWGIDADLYYTIPVISVSSSNEDSIEALHVGSQDQEQLSHDDILEPTPIHPRLSNLHNAAKWESNLIPPFTDTVPLLDCALDRFIAQELNETDCSKQQDKPEVVAPALLGSSKRPMTPTGPPSTTLRPAKRSRIRQVSTDDGNRVPRFRSHQEKKWKELFDQLLEFKKEKGHCLVPHTYDENPPLARWVKRQRYQYKLKEQKMISTLTEDRISQLEGVGFVWDSHAVAWEEHRADLVQFKADFGHCEVPSAYEKNPSLATWVKRQRTQNKMFWSGSKSTMTMERYAVLNKLGFSWEIKKNTKVKHIQ